MDYDAIVIGSGFGGSVAASTLAAQKKNVLILERGTWWITPEKLGKPPALAPGKQRMPDWLKTKSEPVQYWPRPDHKEGLLDVFASVRTGLNKDGLYKFSSFDEATTVTASAVGGGSMIYSNVTIEPAPDVLQQIGLNLAQPEYDAARQWMTDFRGPLNKIVTKIPLPGRDVSKLTDDDYLYLDRVRVLRDAAATLAPKLGIELPWAPLDLAVIEYDPDRGDKSDAAKNHTFCERQGRCLLGCLPAARLTLNKSLYAHLLQDPASGVALWPKAEAQHVRKIDGGYEVLFHDYRDGGEEQTVSAPIVFLAAGTLGTTELLLRSQAENTLELSDALGSHFSTNGDFGAFVVNTAERVSSTRGPINTCEVKALIDGTHITIEDCAIPSMFASIASTALSVLDNVVKRRMFHERLRLAWITHAIPDLRDFLPHLPDTYDPNDMRTESEYVNNIFFFNVMGQDDASGTFSLEGDDLKLDWKHPIADHPTFKRTDELCRRFAEAMGGDYVPLWDALPRKRLMITHPLGGCTIAANRTEGTIDEYGRVFDGDAADITGTHDGLFVVDGSAIPGALAVNPTLTITAQALKAVGRALGAAAAPAAIPAGRHP
jgi:cholesterol oxidase